MKWSKLVNVWNLLTKICECFTIFKLTQTNICECLKIINWNDLKLRNGLSFSNWLDLKLINVLSFSNRGYLKFVHVCFTNFKPDLTPNVLPDGFLAWARPRPAFPSILSHPGPWQLRGRPRCWSIREPTRTSSSHPEIGKKCHFVFYSVALVKQLKIHSLTLK